MTAPGARPALTLGELAALLGATLHGDPARPVDGVGSLEGAGPSQVAFLSNPRYREQLAGTRAAAVILAAAAVDAVPSGCAALVVSNPYAAFARAAQRFAPVRPARPGLHPSAIVDATAQVAPSAEIGPGVVIEAGAVVGERCVIGPGCTIGEGVRIGDDSRLVARVSVCHGCVIGARALIHPGAVIGADGFGFAPDFDRQGQGGWVKIPQTGIVRIGDDVEIGANTTIDRGALDDTVIGDDCKLDNLVQIAHNVQVGAHTVLAGCAGVAGSARIGARCLIGGGAGIAGHISIPDGTTVSGMTMIFQNLKEPGTYTAAWPVMPHRDWERAAAVVRNVDDMRRRLRALERAVAATDAAPEAGGTASDNPTLTQR